MFQILIAVLIIVLVLLIAVVWFQRRALKEINELKSVSDELTKKNLSSQLAAASKMQLIGESKEELANLQKNMMTR